MTGYFPTCVKALQGFLGPVVTGLLVERFNIEPDCRLRITLAQVKVPGFEFHAAAIGIVGPEGVGFVGLFDRTQRFFGIIDAAIDLTAAGVLRYTLCHEL